MESHPGGRELEKWFKSLNVYQSVSSTCSWPRLSFIEVLHLLGPTSGTQLKRRLEPLNAFWKSTCDWPRLIVWSFVLKFSQCSYIGVTVNFHYIVGSTGDKACTRKAPGVLTYNLNKINFDPSSFLNITRIANVTQVTLNCQVWNLKKKTITSVSTVFPQRSTPRS